MADMTKEQAIEILNRDDDEMRKGYFCINDFIAIDTLKKFAKTVEERKQGQWEHDKLFGECAYVCSFCHTVWTSSEIQNMHYCPTCGAEMRGNENE